MSGPEWSGRWRDRYTGYEGHATACTEYIGGNTNLLLEHLGDDGEVIEEWFNVNRLERVEDKRAGFG